MRSNRLVSLLLLSLDIKMLLVQSAPSTATRSPSPVSSGQRQPITLRYRLCSWDVFPYDLLPNQLRPFGLASWTGQQRGRLGETAYQLPPSLRGKCHTAGVTIGAPLPITTLSR